MKKIIILVSAFILINNITLAAGGDSGSSTTKVSMYDEAVKLIKRAGKLEKKDNTDKAVKLYKQAFSKLEKANKKDKNNPDILNIIAKGLYAGPRPSSMKYITPPCTSPWSSLPLYITARVQVKNLVLIPKIAVIHIQKTAPGPPV